MDVVACCTSSWLWVVGGGVVSGGGVGWWWGGLPCGAHGPLTQGNGEGRREFSPNLTNIFFGKITFFIVD